MRLNAFIAACVCGLAAEAGVRFTAPAWRPDLALSVPCLEGGVAVPFDLPRATAYRVTRDGASTLEDRFDTFDLWLSRTRRGRWRDAEGNELQLARLAFRPPDDAPGTVCTRRAFRERLEGRPVNPRNPGQRDEAAACAAPVELGRAVKPRRSRRANFVELICYETTNETALAYAFRPHDPDRKAPAPDWFLAVLTAAPGADMAAVRARFDEEFLDGISVPAPRVRRSLPPPDPTPAADAPEEALLRADVRASVVNYDAWHCADAEGVTVIDDLNASVRASFVAALTNNLPRLRRAYAEIAPTPLAATNALAVVRVFQRREDYLAHVGEAMDWSAALWSPERRELVLCYPPRGEEELLRTVWHEAFHQYLAYAGAMVESSPWFNEGHARLFERSHFDWKGRLVFEREARAAAYVHEYAPRLAEALPDVLLMDYAAFYAGARDEVAARYDLAWSVAYFLSVGAPELRGRPYEDFRARYLAELVRTQSMHAATRAVLGDEKSRDAFVAAWIAFWRTH